MSSTTTAASVKVARHVERVGQVTPNRRAMQALQLIVVLLGVAYALIPVIIVVSASLDPTNSLSGQGLLPRTISLDNYQKMLNDAQHPFMRWIGNSLIVSGVSTIITLALCSL